MRSILLVAALAVLFISCGKSKYPGFKESENGLYYKIVNDSEGTNCKEGDYVKVNMRYTTFTDSLIFDNAKEQLPVWLNVKPFKFKGDIMEGLQMLSQGDSAVFVVNTEDFYLKTVGMQGLPPHAKKDTVIYVAIKILEVKNAEQFAVEAQKMQQEYEVKLEQVRMQEMEKLKEFIEKNKIKEEPKASGLYFISQTQGSGPQVKKGDKVLVHYTGRFIDGQIFDSSEGGEPMPVEVGMGQVIEGFDEALLLMKKGGKARAIIPSSIGYGASEPGGKIPPYTTLVFDIEMVDVQSGQK